MECLTPRPPSGVSARLEESSRGDGLVELAREVGADLVVVATPGGGALLAQADRSWQERKVAAGGAGLARWGLVAAGGGVACVLDRQGETAVREEKVVTAQQTSAGNIGYNFDFLDRERFNQSKKKMEVRKSERLAAALARFDPSTPVEVVALGYPDTTLRAMANTLELEDEERLGRSLEELCRQFPRHRKELREVGELLLRLRSGHKAPVIVLYSLEDTHKFRIIC